jgi:hypothetical protein
MDIVKVLKERYFLLIIMVLVGLRFLHFGPFIDGPHTWRQADTANFIWDFYQNGIDLFNPSVCWMGGHKTLLFEFPLPEAIAAMLYQVFGPDLIWARIVFLLFFIGSIFYLYKLVRLFGNKHLAEITTVIYTMMPLALFYSRAIHIDFSALFFAFGMTYQFAVGIQQESRRELLKGAMLGTFAFLIKAPYAFYFALPLLYVIIRDKKWKFCLKQSWVFLIPVVLFVLWIQYTKHVNSQAPNWSFIPGYRNFTDNSHWYYGNLKQRQNIENWQTIYDRLSNEILGGFGAALFLLGVVTQAWRKQFLFFTIWLLCMPLYVIIFFNLNIIHNYYQIPFLAPVAIFIAMGILFLAQLVKKQSISIAAILTIAVVQEHWRYAENNYYQVLHDQIEIGNVIKENTKTNDLVIVTYGGLSPQCPNILYRARRNGWQISTHFIDARLTFKLIEAGATHYAVIARELPQGEFEESLRFFKGGEVAHMKNGNRIFVFDLRYESNGKPYRINNYKKD